jgi:heat shock protein HtpX
MKNQLKTILLLGALSALVVGVGGAVAPQHITIFALMALLMNLGAYFFSDRIVLAMHHAREIDPAEAPDLHRMVAELASRAGIPMPRVYLIPEAQPNAFATGRNPSHAAVVVTEGILGLLSARELRGVLAHEIAHIKNRDILVSSIAAALASLVTYVAHAFGFLGMHGMHARDEEEHGSPVSGLLLALVAPVAATLIQLGISRSREYLADETGAQLSGDPEALASALMKLERSAAAIPAAAEPATASLFIVNPFSGGGALLNLFSTHPPVQDRVDRLLRMAGAHRYSRGMTSPRAAWMT